MTGSEPVTSDQELTTSWRITLTFHAEDGYLTVKELREFVEKLDSVTGASGAGILDSEPVETYVMGEDWCQMDGIRVTWEQP